MHLDHLRRWAAALGLNALLFIPASCGPRYGMRVPKALVAKLPYESRIELLEAENEFAVAIDRVDESESEILRAREALRRAKSRLSAAHREVGDAEDAAGKEVAKLAVEEGEARVEFLHRRQRLNVEEKEIQQLSLRCAFARFELARLTVARKAKVQGSEKYAPADYEKQVKACDADVAEARKDTQKLQTKLAEARQAWDGHREALAKKTFDARASPYVE